MYYSDVKHLIETEKKREIVVTWYTNPIWQLAKNKVTDKESALRLSRIMRDNRNVAMMLLNIFLVNKHYLFLYTYLNLNYANYDYSLDSLTIENHISTATFTHIERRLKYVNTQKIRKIRVAFESLADYAGKYNRNGYTITNSSIETLIQDTLNLLNSVNSTYVILNQKLVSILDAETVQDSEIEDFLTQTGYDGIALF